MKKKKIKLIPPKENFTKLEINKMTVSQRAERFIEKTITSIPSESEDELIVREKIKKVVLLKKQEILERMK